MSEVYIDPSAHTTNNREVMELQPENAKSVAEKPNIEEEKQLVIQTKEEGESPKVEDVNRKEREKLWEQQYVRPALEHLVPRDVVKQIESEQEAEVKVIDAERQLKGIEHKIEQEKLRSGERWNVDKLFPLKKPVNISKDNMFNEKLEV